MTHSHQGDLIIISSLLVFSLLLLLISWAIKFKKQVNFIAGYDEKTCKDKNGLANYVGGTIFITGIACLGFAIAAFFIPAHIKALMGIYFISLALGTVVAAIGGSRYIKSR